MDSKNNTVEKLSADEKPIVQTDYPELWPGWKTVRLIGKGSYGAVYEIRRESNGVVESAALNVISIPKEESEISSLRSNGMDDVSITNWFDECMQDMLKEYGCMRDMKGHTNIVYCDDFNTVKHKDGLGWDIYIKMELLTALTEVMKQKALSEDDIIHLGKDICKALIVCKNKNVVHRDVKPQNIFVSRDGDYKLGDFGVSIISDHTTQAQTAGTYKFMAPEVYFNKPYGSKADICSLGLVMYWLLNEKRAPCEPLPPQPVMKSQAEKARNQRFSGESIPAPCNGSDELKRIVMKACEFKIENRYQSAQEMLDDLEAIGKVKGKKPLGKVICAIAGAALLVGAAAFGISRLGKTPAHSPENPTPTAIFAEAPAATANPTVAEATVPETAAAEPTIAEAAYDSETMRRIILTANDEMNVKEFNASVAVVKERLDVLTSGTEYGFTVHEDTVEVILPKACLYDVAVEDALMCYISRPIELFLVDPATAGWFGTPPTKIDLARSDIESVSLKNGSIDGLDPAKYELTIDTYPYLEMTLTESFFEKHKEELANWSSVVLAQDMSNSDWFYMDIIFHEDGRTFDVFNCDIDGHFVETMAYNYTHDPLPNAFYFNVEPDITWIDTAQAINIGKNQCNESDLRGKEVLALYSSYSLTDTTSGAWVDTCTALQARLDTLEQPYALGYVETDDGINVAFKTNPEHLSEEILKIIGCKNYGITLRLGLQQESFHIDEMDSVVENAGGTFAYAINMGSSAASLQEFTHGVKEKTELKLIISDTPVLSTYIDEPITNGKIAFQNPFPNNHEAIQDSNIWFVHLMDAVLHETSMNSLYLSSSFYVDEDENKASQSDFSINFISDEAAVREVIKDHAPEATVTMTGTTLSVFLHLDVDETLARTSTDLVKEIYESLNFEESSFDTIGFYLIDEDNEAMERARIFFRKAYYNGRIEVNGIFKNGRLDRYSQYFLHIVRNTPFYFQKVGTAITPWDC